MHITDTVREAERLMTICNACRYCEGLCAVFPAMERRRLFSAGDLSYLANLCHNCGACYHDCQYAPPHEFAVNVPRTFARLRRESYAAYAWPRFLGRAYERNGIAVALLTAFGLALLFAVTFAIASPETVFASHADADGGFYNVMPHNVMVGIFGPVGLFVLLALAISVRRFWRATGETAKPFGQAGPLASAAHDALSLKYLHGGGAGCSVEEEKPSPLRRIFHHLTFYGFLLCFAATSLATVYHYGFGWEAPYGYTSLPKILGIVGGIGLLAGPVGLLWLRQRRNPALAEPDARGMDVGFLVLLFLTSLTGLALMLARETSATGLLLAIHLGVVMGLFLTLPYGKFVHGVHRVAALIRYAIERRRPAPSALAD